MQVDKTHDEETKIKIGASVAQTARVRAEVDVCVTVMGKRHSELPPDELREFHRLSKAASYYRRHAENVKNQREDKQAVKRKVIESLGIPAACQRCGYDRYIGALDFHHRDPDVKDHTVLAKGFASALEEARKCDLICSNCHREAHAADDTKKRSTGRPRKIDPRMDKYLAAVGVTRN